MYVRTAGYRALATTGELALSPGFPAFLAAGKAGKPGDEASLDGSNCPASVSHRQFLRRTASFPGIAPQKTPPDQEQLPTMTEYIDYSTQSAE